MPKKDIYGNEEIGVRLQDMMTDSYILSAKDIHREFQTLQQPLSVLKGVDLALRPYETAAITGVSGIGKSTLLHILGGLDKPTKGQVAIGGVELQGKSEEALAQFRNEKVGFVFQFHYLLEDFSALENVMIPMLVAGKSKKESVENAEHLLELVGLIDRRDHRPAELSGGEQQRVAVARALSNSPMLVIADEPSGNLDSATGNKLHELMMTLNDEKKITFLIATHNLDLSQQCQRRFKIVEGKLVES